MRSVGAHCPTKLALVSRPITLSTAAPTTAPPPSTSQVADGIADVARPIFLTISAPRWLLPAVVTPPRSAVCFIVSMRSLLSQLCELALSPVALLVCTTCAQISAPSDGTFDACDLEGDASPKVSQLRITPGGAPTG